MRLAKTTVAALLVALTLVASACGDDETKVVDSKDSPRTVNVEMLDNDFRSEPLEFKSGETVRFVFNNRGSVAHEAFIGNAHAQSLHGAQMATSSTMGHDDMADGMDGAGNMGGSKDDGVTVPPGASRELMHTFDKAGSLEIGCHQPGHYESGMKARVKVS